MKRLKVFRIGLFQAICLAVGCFQAVGSTATPKDMSALQAEFFVATTNGDTNRLTELLAAGVNVDCRDSKGLTALIMAARVGDLITTRFLVENGANINARSSSKMGSTVLAFSLDAPSDAVTRYLLDQGVAVDRQSRSGVTPLLYAVFNQKHAFAELLLKAGAKPDATGRDAYNNLLTPLAAAVAKQNTNFVALLLKHGARLEKRSANGMTPLMIACWHTNASVSLVRQLISAGAKVNAQGSDDRTPLMLAALGSSPAVVSLLLESGADITLTSPGETWIPPDHPTNRRNAEELAAAHKKRENAKLLKEARRLALVKAGKLHANEPLPEDATIAEFLKLHASTPVTCDLPSDANFVVRYFDAVSHAFHGMIMTGSNRHQDRRVPPASGGGHMKFLYDASGRLHYVIQIMPGAKPYVSNRILYKGGLPYCNASYDKGKSSLADYILYREGAPQYSGRVLDHERVVLIEDIKGETVPPFLVSVDDEQGHSNAPPDS